MRHAFVVRVASSEKTMRTAEKRLIDDLGGLQSGLNIGKKRNMSFARAMYPPMYVKIDEGHRQVY